MVFGFLFEPGVIYFAEWKRREVAKLETFQLSGNRLIFWTKQTNKRPQKPYAAGVFACLAKNSISAFLIKALLEIFNRKAVSRSSILNESEARKPTVEGRFFVAVAINKNRGSTFPKIIAHRPPSRDHAQLLSFYTI